MTKTILAALAATVAATPALAQQIADAKIAVVDSERLFGECTACRGANTQLQAQRTQLQTQAQQLGAPLQTEATSLQTAITAAKGNPDAALQTRIRAFETKQQSAQQSLARQQQTFERNVAYVRQQIGTKVGPIIQTVAQQRGATLAIEKGNTFYSAPTIDITDAVLAQLNSQLPSVSTTAPAQAAPAAGTAPAATTPPATRPQPSGR